jgi:chromosome segregation ATPase
VGQTSADLVALNVARHSGSKGTVTMMRSNDDQSAPQPRDIESLMSLIALVSDPKAAATRVKLLSDAAAAAAAAKAELAKLDEVKAGLAAEIAAARAAARGEMDRDRELQQAELARRHQELNSREQQIELRKAEVGKLHAEGSKLKADWEAKTRHLRAAMSQGAA